MLPILNELLNGEIFYTLKEAQVVIEHWKKHYNTRRPHSALGCRAPTLEAVMPKDMRGAMAPGWRLELT
jgi:hypothetical protein